MKKLKNILAIALILLLSSYAKAQMDTLNYLKQFEVNKAIYIGKPLSLLLNDMKEIQPKTIWNYGPFNDKKMRTSSDLKFCNIEESLKKNVIRFSIEWASPIPAVETNYYRDKNKSKFTEDEKSFYGNKIIKDIKVYR
ncbi:TPA: hypothetical protein ACGZ9U_001352 [Elizabethkingia anophelis]